MEYYALDAIGSVRVVFNADGTVNGRMDYTPFGGELQPAVSLPPEAFAGLFRDPEAGLDHAQARSYQVRTGRFSTVDPIYAGLFDPQQWNRYAYALNSPGTYADPDGLEAIRREYFFGQPAKDYARIESGGNGGGGSENVGGGWESSAGRGGPRVGGVSGPGPDDDPDPGNGCNQETLGSGGLRNFMWGVGDVALLGFGDDFRDALGIDPADMNSNAYFAGGIVGSVSILATGVGGGIRAARAAAKGLEFSHFIPARVGGARSIWNGNFVSTVTHALSDPFRYRFMPRSWKAANPMPNRARQLWVRSPNTAKGTAAGAGTAATGLARAGC